MPKVIGPPTPSRSFPMIGGLDRDRAERKQRPSLESRRLRRTSSTTFNNDHDGHGKQTCCDRFRLPGVCRGQIGIETPLRRLSANQLYCPASQFLLLLASASRASC